jgi:C1A family cysteine protease
MRSLPLLAILLLAASAAKAQDTSSPDPAPRGLGLLEPTKGRAPAQRVADPRAAGLLRAPAPTDLPAKWDARDEGWVSPAKDQEPTGACWAFASLASLETQLLRTGRGLHDFSERNMINLHGWTELDGEYGGADELAAAYLLRWTGPVAESNDVFGVVQRLADWTHESPSLPPVIQVRDIVWTETLDGTPERIAALKAAVMEYGAVATTMYSASGYLKEYDGSISHYCSMTPRANHAVTVVGWDDDYPTNAFKTMPPGPGAWIVKNSWGPDWGDGGCFRVSYHDAVFARQDSGAIYLPAGPGEEYDAVRGHDREGPMFDAAGPNSAIRSDHDLQASVFTAAWNERLEAVGVWTRLFPHFGEILVYTNVTRGAATPLAGGALARRQSVALERAGFTTIPLEEPVPLAPGTAFAVLYRQTGTNLSNFVNCDYADRCYPDHRTGDSYFGRYDEDEGVEGSAWFDGKTIAEQDPDHVDPTDGSWATTIKAYTRCVSPAPAADAPDEADDGTEYLADLAATNATLFAESGGSFGATAGLVGANGRSLWASWLAGFDPSDPASRDLVVSIDLEGGEPRIGWTPDLGDARAYTLWGRDSLAPSDGWRAVDPAAPSATGARFFRVSVGATNATSAAPGP